MGSNKRLRYIDCLRGFSMIFVVYHHILLFSIGAEVPSSWFAELVKTFRMPLFFFISGFVSYKIAFDWNIKNFGILLTKKLRGQLFPTFVMFFIFVLLHDKAFSENIFSDQKSGYWFTLVSFEIFLIYCIINLATRRIKSQNILLIILFASALFISCVLKRYDFFYSRTSNVFSLIFVLQYYFYFIFGIIVKAKLNTFHKLIENNIFNSVIFILAFILPYFFPAYCWKIIILSRLCCIYTLFYKTQTYLESDNILSNGLSLIGTHTLEIYFLHYFLLFRLPLITLLLKAIINDVCFHGSSAEWLVEIIIIGCLSILICLICIGIKKFIDFFPIISEFCFGPQKNKKQ